MEKELMESILGLAKSCKRDDGSGIEQFIKTFEDFISKHYPTVREEASVGQS